MSASQALLLFSILAFLAWNSSSADEVQCLECHENIVKNFALSYHYTVMGELITCENCHGDATTHLQDSKKESLVAYSTEDQKKRMKLNRPCLECHEDSDHAAKWNHRSFLKKGINCVSCHKGHSSVAIVKISK